MSLAAAQVAGESYLDQRLRVVVAELVCRLGDQECAQHSAGLLADWQTQQVDIRYLSIYLSIYVSIYQLLNKSYIQQILLFKGTLHLI